MSGERLQDHSDVLTIGQKLWFIAAILLCISIVIGSIINVHTDRIPNANLYCEFINSRYVQLDNKYYCIDIVTDKLILIEWAIPYETIKTK